MGGATPVGSVPGHPCKLNGSGFLNHSRVRELRIGRLLFMGRRNRCQNRLELVAKAGSEVGKAEKVKM